MSKFNHRPTDFSWIPPEDRDYGVEKETDAALSALPVIEDVGKKVKGTWSGETVRLDKVLEEACGYYPIVRQMIGDCVSFGWGKGIMIAMAVDILVRKQNERWPGREICTEWLYGTGRVLVGRGRLGNDDGSIGSWQAKAVVDHGTLLRKIYEIETKKGKKETFDLRRYSGKRAKSWGWRGLPHAMLEPTADEHPVNPKPALITNFDRAADAISNGSPIAVCSNQGFNDVRDRDGFLRPTGRWNHCMLLMGVRGGRRPGLLCDNTSWGKNWVSGPKPEGIPDGCFWIEARHATRMLSQNDSFAIPGSAGYVRTRFNHSPI